MKKIISIFLSFSIVFLSVSTCIPISVCADTDKTVLSKSSDSPFAYSSSEAQKYVSAHLDIYDSDNTLLFSYTPTSTYNWTYSAKGKDNLHLSDNQLKAFLMSKKTLSAYAQLMFSGFSNNNVTRGFLSALGIATTGNSNALTDVSDKLLGNYNYIDSINYNEDTQTITMDNTSVDKLREEIKNYWYKEKGLLTGAVGSYHCSTKSYFLNNILKNGWFDYEEDYNEYFNNIKNTDYSFVFTDDNNSAYVTYLLNKSDISYFYLNHEFSDYYSLNFANSVGYNVGFTNITNRLNLRDFYSSITSRDYSDCDTSVFSSIKFYLEYYNSVYSFKQSYSSRFLKKDGSEYDVLSSNGTYYFVCDELPLIFKNEASMKSFIEGSDSFLASTINKTGEDITFSIDKMNENIGEKLDSLVDSINSGKGNMSADELQNAIDKGLEDLNKNTEDIKDNTSDILGVLKEQNQILLDILGVTTNIYKVVKESDSKEKTYNINYVQSVFNSMFKGLKNAILYGENTVRDDVSEDTDDIDSIVSDIPPDKKNYHNGLFGRFPFSVPYQLFDWLQALYVEPVAPKFTLSYAYLFKDLGYETNNFEFVIDLGDEKYSKWIELVRSGEKLSFIIYMAIATYHRFKNEI